MKKPGMVKFASFLLAMSIVVGPIQGRLMAQEDDELSLDLDAEDAAAQAPSGTDAGGDDLGLEELEADLPAENAPPPELPPDTPVQDVSAQGSPAPEAAAPSEPAPEAPVAEPTKPAAQPVTVTAIDFKANENGGTVVIKTSGQAVYNTRPGADGRQLIVDIENATLPARLKRPFNTKDFTSAIGLINAYQEKGSTTARVVIQLKQPIQPTVTQEGGSIMVMALGSAEQPVAAQAEEPVAAPEPPSEEAVTAQPAPTQSGSPEQALGGKTLDEFLASDMKFFGSPISIQVKDGDLRDVFNFISEESGLNLVLSDDVSGKISLKLREIPWDQALIVIMQAKQLGYIRQGSIIRIAPLRTIRAETDQTRDLIEAQKTLQPVRVKVFPISYAKAPDMIQQVQPFLSERRGKVQADARTNSLVVTDTVDVLSKVGKIIQALDTQPPQVLIEGKVIEAKEDFARGFGVAWSLNGSANRARGVPQVSISGAASPSVLNMTTFGTVNDFDPIDATIQLGESEGKTRILSSPRIVVINNQKATIQQTQETPIQTTVQTTSGSSTSVSFKQARLQLDVTPQITADGGILLAMNVLQEFFGPATDVGGASSSTQAIPTESRRADTNILVRNGETAVVGGIYSSSEQDNETGIPFIRKIPILGSLFGSNNTRKQKNELMIFLSPRILNQQEAFGATTQIEAPADSALE